MVDSVDSSATIGTPREARPLSQFMVDHERAIIRIGALVGFLAFWEASARLELVNPIFISSPSMVTIAAVQLFQSAEFWSDLRISGIEFIIGYVMAIIVGVPLGLATGWFTRLNYAFSPFLHTLNVVPRITWLPLIIIWVGIGIWSKVTVAFLGAVIPIIIATYSGVQVNESRFMRVARSFSASQWKIFSSIVLPGTVPFMFTGMKYASGRALLGVIVGEMYAATAGIGYFINATGNAFQTDKMLVGVLVMIFVGLTIVELLNAVERRFDVWRPKVGQ